MGHNYYAITPQSTAIGSPIAKEAASEHDHTIASVISSGKSIRSTNRRAVSAASVSFVTPVRDQASALGYAMANCIHTDILLVTIEGSRFDQLLHAIHAGNAQ